MEKNLADTFVTWKRKKYVSKTINKVNVNGLLIRDPVKILKEQKKYYENLYEEKDPGLIYNNEFLATQNVKKLSDMQKLSCEGLITLTEIKYVIKNAKNNKSPGCDGIPWEFYKIFYKDISIFLLRSLNDAFANKNLSITQKQGIITCLPKGDKPREYFKNWRPITLLNCDYKILSGVLANRMKNVLPDIIGEDQKGFIKGRFMGENTRVLYDVMEYLIHSKKVGLLLLIDFEKAFDSLKFSYIREILKTYNFGETYISWFNLIYKDVKSCVLNNGFVSNFFKVNRGWRQGDPWSPYLFILCVEPLAQAIINSRCINGIDIKNNIYKIGQYADDTFILLDGTEQSLRNCLLLLERYAHCSGLKLNIDKTNVVWLGTKVKCNDILCPDLSLKWVNNFKLLGIYFTSDLMGMLRMNYDQHLMKVENILKAYGKRHLSLIGKVTVIKTLIVPMFVHALTVLPAPEKQFYTIFNRLTREFLWKNGRVMVSCENLSKDIEHGGLKLTNIEELSKALKITWIKRIYTSEGSWQNLVKAILGESEKEQIWELDPVSLEKYSKKMSNRFWKEVLSDWAQYTLSLEKNNLILQYPIWNGFFLKNENLKRIKKDFIGYGCRKVQDLFNVNEKRMYNYNEFCEKYGRLNVLDYMSLIQSIPKQWKTYLINAEFDNFVDEHVMPAHLIKLIQTEKVCKYVYWLLIYKKTKKNNYTNELKWIDRDILYIENGDRRIWKTFYYMSYKATLDSHMRSFQYKLVSRILVTNRQLKMYKIKDTDLCEFCNMEIETYEHLFYECVYVKRIWFRIQNWLYPNMIFTQNIQVKHTIFGFEFDTADNNLFNFMMLIVKKYIYNCRCKDIKPRFETALLEIKKYHKIEQQLSNCSQKYQKRWNEILNKINAV
jgi:hypothetical protein